MTSKRMWFLSAGLTLLCLNSSGQYGVGQASMTLRDPDRGNRKVTFEAFYPVISLGANADSGKACTARFPVICFAHGYQHPGNKYENLTAMLVPEGYIVLSLTTASGLFPSHKNYADDIRFLAMKAFELGRDINSPLYGIIDTLCCLMGHSMGGGAIFQAARNNPAIVAVVALAPYDTKPSAISAAAEVGAPTLIFSGTNDCITPTGKHHLPMYEMSASEFKTFILIKGGTHCSMGDYSRCVKAEKISGCTPGLTTAEQTAVLARYMLPWLDYVLKGEKEQGRRFDKTISTDTAVTWLRSQPLM